MRIAHLADYGGPYAGSFVPMMLAAADEAQARGHEPVLVFTPVARGRPWLEELAAHDVRFAASTEAAALSAAVADVLPEAGGQCILHTNFTAFDMPAVRGAKGRDGAHVVWHIHTKLSTDPKIRLANTVKFGVFGRGVDEILCVAPDLVQGVRRRLAPRRRVVAFPNAIDASRFPPATPERRASARAALGIAPDAQVVLHFGWDWELKGGDVLAAAMERVRADSRGAGILAVTVGGEGTPAGGAEVAPGLRRVPPSNDVTSFYAAADVFVSASPAEGMPFALLEALASGLPVVSTDLPGPSAILSGAPGSKLVPVGDSVALGNAILDAVGSTQAELSASAAAWVRQSAGVDAWAARLVDRFEALV